MITKFDVDFYNTWEHSSILRQLYRERCRREIPEMTCHAQAADILKAKVVGGDTVLDVGCGSGYFFHSLVDRKMPVEYWGIDASKSLITIGKEELPAFGLPSANLLNMRIEDLDASFDHIVCINVLSNCDNYHRPLDRILKMAKKTVILRESIKDKSEYSFVRDCYLDKGIDLKVHVNHYGQQELSDFIQAYGYSTNIILDLRTGGKPEIVIDHPHYWTFITATRKLYV